MPASSAIFFAFNYCVVNIVLKIKQLNFDPHIIATLFLRFWSVIAGGITVILIPVFFSPVEQGYYYTFNNILMLQVFFELGMGQVIIQLAAHEAAQLRDGNGDSVRSKAFARLASLRKLLAKWYMAVFLLFVISVVVAGFFFFWNSELPLEKWIYPWIFLVLATGINLNLSWRLAILEGQGYVKDVNRVRLVQSIFGFGLMWALMMVGGGLWSVFIVPAVAAIYTIFWLNKSRLHDDSAGAASNKEQSDGGNINWRTEILPFQWRIAVSWISGFFIFQLFTPVAFKYYGAAEAGRLGLCITLFNSLVAVSTSWVGAKVPVIGGLISQEKRVEASALYKRMASFSFIFTIFSTSILVLSIYLVKWLGFPIASRLPEMISVIFIALACLGNAFINSAALFMRAHKEEPLLYCSIAMAALVALACNLTASWGVNWIMASYGMLVWLVSLPWTLIMLKRYYKPQPRA